MKSEIRYIFFIKRKVVQDESTIVKLNYLRSNYFRSIFQMSRCRHITAQRFQPIRRSSSRLPENISSPCP